MPIKQHLLYLLCGVPGSGKTWVVRQLVHKFLWIPQEDYWRDNQHVPAIKRASTIATKPMITECPFGERALKEDIEKAGIHVIPYFIVEDPDTVARRYAERERKQLPKNAYTRASTIRDRAMEWGAVYGTSEEILKLLMQV